MPHRPDGEREERWERFAKYLRVVSAIGFVCFFLTTLFLIGRSRAGVSRSVKQGKRPFSSSGAPSSRRSCFWRGERQNPGSFRPRRPGAAVAEGHEPTANATVLPYVHLHAGRRLRHRWRGRIRDRHLEARRLSRGGRCAQWRLRARLVADRPRALPRCRRNLESWRRRRPAAIAQPCALATPVCSVQGETAAGIP